MRKMKRILSFIMACVIFISSANTGVYATELDEPVTIVEESVETTECESTEIVESADGIGEVLDEAEREVLTENPQDLPDVRDYDDLLEMEAIEIDPNEIQGEVYDADELVELRENMPALMSTSYHLYWDNYTSYYIYNRLGADERKLWDALEVLYASYLEDETDLNDGYADYVNIKTTEPITKEELLGLANMFKYSHPQYYYLRSGYGYYADESQVALAFMVYDAFTDGTDRKNATNAIKTQLDAWCDQIALGNTEEEKVKIIHDIICDNVDYNDGVLDDDNGDGKQEITEEEEQAYFTQSAYSVFCTDLTVCAGYTQSFMWLCNAFDIECFGVTSPGHGWNKVKVNDNWYNVDVTWDDNDGVGNRDYYCYLRNDAYIHTLSSHDEEAEWLPYLPACTLDSGSDFYNAGKLPEVTQQVAKPVISIVEGDTGYTITMECATDGADIFYTLDGTTPSEANSKSYLYTGAVNINQTATIRAIAVRDEYLDSTVAEGGNIDEIEYIVDSGACGTNVTWQLDSRGVLTISGSSDMESYASADAVPWYTYSQDIQSVKIEDGVTSVGDYAFSSLSNLQAIELASSITKIGAYAFYYSVLEEITIPVGVTEICDYAFYGAGLTKIEMPSSVTAIGEYAFYTSDLEELEIPASVTEIGTYAFANCYDLVQVRICGNPTTIGERVFQNCDKLTEVELSDTYTKIGTMMFLSCDGLVSIELPESLTEIGQQALSYCSKLEEIVIPAKVVMQPYAFYYNTGLKKVTIEDGVTTISYGAFNLCSALEEIRIPKSVTSIGNIAIDVTATIYGYAGSAAETYASNNGNVFVDISNTEYEVHFVTGTEEQITSVIYQRDALITEPVLGERTGYTFDGWYTSDEIHDETTKWDFENDTVTKSITLYAHWIPNEYEVIFDAGEGTLGTTKITVTYDAAYGELPTPVRENYTFLGWYTALEDGMLVDAETIVSTAGNHTLYALYEVTIVASDTYDGAFGNGEWKLDVLGTMTVSGYAGSFYNIPTEHVNATVKLVFKEGITEIEGTAFRNFVNVTTIVLPESVTEIGEQAFLGCKSLTKINLPNSITCIGESAFSNCVALQQITLPNGLTELSPYIFSGCRLSSIEIPETITKIGRSAFFGCSFVNVTIPDTVKEVEGYVFQACKNLETVTLPAGITYISDGLFAACESLRAVTIPESVISIGGEAFRDCKTLEEIIIPANVETIGVKAFKGCASISECVIPEKVKEIGNNAFGGCIGLSTITIPENVKTLGEELFYGCRGLTSVIIEDGVETLGTRAFFSCSNLEYVCFAGNLFYDSAVFDDTYWYEHTKLFTAGPLSGDYDVEFGWTEAIPDYAFAHLKWLQSCMIPDTVTKIGNFAFWNSGLTAIEIPFGVISIGEGAFKDCEDLTQVYVPKTVTSIGSTAFAETTAIIGFTDSAAYTYAMDNGNEFIDILDLAIKVEFVTDADKEIETQYYFEESLVPEPVGLEKTGYTLEGWYTSAEVQDEDTKWDFQNKKVTEDITLYAKWSPNVYKVSFSLGYDGASAIESLDVLYDSMYGELPTPTRNNYTFIGWYTAVENGVLVTEESILKTAEDHTLYAKYEPSTIASGICGDSLTWTLKPNNESGTTYTLNISGEGAMREYSYSIRPTWDEYKENITNVEIADGVTNIGDEAFIGYSNLRKITIPASVTKIGERTFSDCGFTSAGPIGGGYDYEYGWTEVIPAYAFYRCYKLTEAIIADGITSIGGGAFRDTGLKKITIPASVTSFCEDGSAEVFGGCGFTSVGPIGSGCDIEYGWTDRIPNIAFLGCRFIEYAEIAEGIKEIGNSAFSGCEKLKKVTIPDGVTEIGSGAFNNCAFTSAGPVGGGYDYEFNWTKVILDNAFYGCSKLESVELPDGVKHIGNNAFRDCKQLKTIVLPDSVTSIGYCAFDACESLTELTIPNAVTVISSSVFNGCVSLKELVIPEGVTKIEGSTFRDCSNLTSVMIPNGVKTIGDSAFEGCSSLTEISLPDTLTIIGENAFLNCTKLAKIVVPDGIEICGTVFEGCGFTSAGPIGSGCDFEYGWTEIIPEYAFYGCSKLDKVIIGESIKGIDRYALENCGDLKTVGPIGGGYDIEYAWKSAIPDKAFGGYTGLNHLIEVVIADGIETIGDGSFAGQSKLEKIIIPKSVTTIKDINSGIFYYLEVYGYRGTAAETFATEKGLDFVAIDDLVCTLTFDGNGGEVDGTGEKVIFKGEACGELPVPKRTGYTFEGWYTTLEDGEKITAATVFEEDTILHARWSANTYTVTFDANGGSLAGAVSREIAFGTVYGELPVPTRIAATFVGWFTALEGGEEITADDILSVDEDHTLYARWDFEEYQVSFNTSVGQTPVGIVVYYGEPYGELPEMAYAGAEFLGWFTEAGEQIMAETIVKVMEDHTLYAHWGLKYKVTNPVARLLDGTNPEGMEVAPETRIYLTTETNGAQIYFTKDVGVNLVLSAENGTLAEVATLYEDAIELTESGTLYVIAVKEGYVCSEVLSVSYIVTDDSYDWGDITEEDIAEQGFSTTADVPKELWVAGIAEETDYTGKAITYPQLRVYSYTTLLKEKTDYTVKYKNNKNAGEATITITGKGNYAGSIVKTFTIKPLDLSKATIENVTLQYNKKVQKATTKVTYELSDGKTVTLKKGTDFNFIYPGTDKKAEDYDADAFKEVGTYTVYLVGKGNYYTKDDYSVAFEVTIVEETLISKMSLTKIPNQKYTGEEITPSVTLMHGSKKLEEGTDYEIVEYINNVGVGTASIVIEGMGDYVGTRTATFKITGTALSKVPMSGFAKSLPWTGEEVLQDVTFSYTVGKGEEAYTEYLEEGTHYTVTYQKNISVGTANVIFEGIEENGYTGIIKKTYKITGVSMKNVEVTGWLPTIAYDGGDNTQDGYELTYTIGEGEEEQVIPLVEDIEGTGEGDYRVSYKNNGKAGTATVTFIGINGYTGSINKTYKITAYDLSSEDGRISVSEITDQTYRKGGVVLGDLEVIYTTTGGDEILLAEGRDYTLKYDNNKAVADKTAKKAPMVTITGKGNFKGKQTQKFTIVGSNLSVTDMVAGDVVYQKKAGICKPSITLYDRDGKKLKSNTDYHKTVTYTYAKDVEVTQMVDKKTTVSVTRLQGEAVDAKDIIPVGAEITATVTGIKNYAGTEDLPSTQSATFKFIAANIAKAKVTVAAQTYTGKAVEPTKDDIIVKFGNSTPLEKTDYEIVSYSNNDKKGTAKVTIRGIGDYGGEKTVTFKINSKSMNYTITYHKNAEDATGKMKVSSISAGKKLTANTYKRTGWKFVGWNTMADGSGEFYENKAAFYLEGFSWIFGRQVTLYAQWDLIEYKITYKLDGGTNTDTNPATYNIESEAILLEEPEREGYTFGGWYTSSNFSSKSLVTEIKEGSTGNKTLYAKWIKIE